MSNSKWKTIFSKKWTFPAIYLVTAALILALMFWYQDPNEYPLTSDDLGLEQVNPDAVLDSPNDGDLASKLGETILVGLTLEKMQWPVTDFNEVQVSMEYFDENASEEEMEKAIVTFQNDLYPHTGIDINSANGEPFEVVAALSGEVTRAEKDPVMGYVVELNHENGLVTVYSSLTDLKVGLGDKVAKGTPIGVASKNMFEMEQQVHLHFEVRKDNNSLNPYAFFDRDMNEALEMLSERQEKTE